MKFDKMEWIGEKMNCNDHKTYHSRAAAERALADLIAHAKRTGQGGKSWRRLNVFPCGNHFHVGRANKLPQNHKPAQPQPKLITFGEARRKLAALDRQLDRTIDYCHRKRAETYAKIIEADRLAGWLD